MLMGDQRQSRLEACVAINVDVATKHFFRIHAVNGYVFCTI